MIASTPSGGTVHSPHAEITRRASLEQERDDTHGSRMTGRKALKRQFMQKNKEILSSFTHPRVGQNLDVVVPFLKVAVRQNDSLNKVECPETR